MDDLTTSTSQSFFIPNNSVVGDYILQEVIGYGGMSVVYRAYHNQLRRTVALKIINKQLQSFQKLAAEARTMAQLDHPNIVRIYDIGTTPYFYFAMEFIKGTTLHEWLRRNNNYSIENLAPILLQLATALEFIHSKNIIHQDIKPSNVLITPNNQLKVMDFGISRVAPRMVPTQKSEFTPVGTPKYMAPEQISGSASYKTDIYGFGATLYEVVCGKPPFQGRSYNVMVDVLTKEPITPSVLNPQVSPEIEAICLKCLQKVPANRYASVKQLIRDIKNAQAHQPILAKKYTKWQASKKFFKRHIVAITSMIAVVFMLLCFCVYLFWQKNRIELYANNIHDLKKEVDLVRDATTQTLKRAFEEYSTLQQSDTFLQPLRKLLLKIPQSDKKYPVIYGMCFGLNSGKYALKKSLQLLQQKIEKDPDDMELFITRGNIYLHNNMVDKAIADFDYVLQKKPQSITAYLNKANALTRKLEYDKAKQLYDKLLKMEPTYAKGYYNRGRWFSIQKKLKEAIKDYKLTTMYNPAYAPAYNNLGYAYMRTRQLDKAVENYTKAISLDKKNWQSLFNRAIVYMQLGNYEKATVDLEAAHAEKPKQSQIHCYLGMVYFNQGTLSKAKKYLQLALENAELPRHLRQRAEKILRHIRNK
ncbi:protein kinase domain-containing protein [Candidatus Uabimicrobium amorphum]|uniref:Serine/threonine protein kinase n=1 Tax=Uabimicrobium amorphum TaxID=2596890 RepID=A0A5S9IL31_UABAM|nr:serine/threonine-protein kinase [Candidatus Uabimicrobium amorphum]BBM83849.1 serine/threonine protein kinase [Candidatus Uabimicrobium amorphum]